MNAIEFDSVSFSYDGCTKALDGVTLGIGRGELVCVLGGNGSGKSTLARHVDALLLPDEGTVTVLGHDTRDADALLEIRSSAGLVFQNPDDQIVAAVVEDDVAFGPENLGVPSAELPARVSEALERVGLGTFAKRETHALSGGQKQRVAIAGAYAMDPRIMVFDEAGAMLDPRGRRGLMGLCRELNEAGITVVLITHFMEEAAACDRVVVLDGGTVAMDGVPGDVLVRARELQELALEAPFATRMSLALQDAGVPVAACIDEAALEGELSALSGDDNRLPGHDLSRLASGCEIRGNDCPTDFLPCRIALRGMPLAPVDDRAPREAAEDVFRSETPIITFERVSYSYASKRAIKKGGDGVWALRDATFSIREGDFLGIAGHTGSGKSTLAQLVAGILHPTEGVARAYGRDMADKRASNEIRRSVGIVFQYPEHQLFAPTVFEDVAFGPRNLGLAADEVDERVRKALRQVHLDPDDLGGKSPFELSGGQQRRVALAGVLAMQPKVLVLDEPTAGLDPRAHEMFLELIAELHATANAATVIVSHNMDDLAQLCNRIMLLNKGGIVADGAPARIFSDAEAIRGIGLDVPHTVRLAERLGLMGSFAGVPTIEQLAEAVAACRAASGDGGAR